MKKQNYKVTFVNKVSSMPFYHRISIRHFMSINLVLLYNQMNPKQANFASFVFRRQQPIN